MFLFQELEDSFNYGLFQPPLNGRAGETKMLMLSMLSMLLIMLMLMLLKLLTFQFSGKFLDEERRLSEYPFEGSVGHLEVIILLSAIHDNYFMLNGLLLHHP